MPILSDGQVVDVSSVRARYHATRLNIHITRDTPHCDLYKLVDIVFAHKKDKLANWQSRYHFSGHTLGDEDWLNSLTEADRACLFEWLKESHMYYEIEGARRKLIYDDLPAAIISQPYPETLYSSLRKQVLAMPETCMPASQWRQTLLNLQQKAIRREELNWSGVMEFLARPEHGPEIRISKHAVLANIDYSSIRLELINELVSGRHDRKQLDFRAKYRHISLFGGEDYREWLVCLPDYPPSHFGSHFTERNILLHIRTKTRFDTKGRKLLFIEEIQSDWHQVSVKNPRIYPHVRLPPAPFRKEWVSLGLKLMLVHAVNEGFDGLAWADGEIQAARYRAEFPSIRRIYEKEIGRHLLGLARNWHGQIALAEFTTKAPCLQIKPLKGLRRYQNRHECIQPPEHDGQEALAILDQYSQTATLQLPVFMIPKGMVHYIQTEGLPLFGDKIIQAPLSCCHSNVT